MRKTRLLTILLFFILSTHFSLAVTDFNDYLDIENSQGKNGLNIKAVVYQVQGECYMEDMNAPDHYLPVSNKTPLNISQNVKTNNGKMIVFIKKGDEPIAAITLDQETTLNISSTNKDSIYIHLANGSGRYYVSSIAPLYLSVIVHTEEGTQIITGQEKNADFVVTLANDHTIIYTLLENVDLSLIDSHNKLNTYNPTKKKFILEDNLNFNEIASISKDEIWWEDSFYLSVLPEFTRKIGTISNRAFIIACLLFGVVLFASIFKTKKEMALKKIVDAPYVIDEKK